MITSRTDTKGRPLPETFADPEVLAFYKELPFNIRGDARQQAEAIRNGNPMARYAPMLPCLHREARVLDVGCGAGTLINSVGYHHGCAVAGIDFNPGAIRRAAEVARLLGLDRATFLAEDLFLYEPEAPFDLVISHGVLHHTRNCLAAVRRICSRFVRPGGLALIGLYHLHGRRPFLDYFAGLRASGATLDAMKAEYARLHPQVAGDETLLLSWFRDQTMHPHETQHTLAELLEVFAETGMGLMATSINRFQPFSSVEELLTIEQELGEAGRRALAEGRYYPGFFDVVARKAEISPP